MSADLTLLDKDAMSQNLKNLAREYKKLSGGTPAEIIVVGGSAVVLDYGFRAQSSDIDVYYQGSSVIKDAAKKVAENSGLRDDWFNNDFIYVAKCNHEKLREHSHHYRTYGNGNFEIRILEPEYIIALKMLSARDFRNDISDIIGILDSKQTEGCPLTFNDIKTAITELFGNEDRIDKDIINEVKAYCEITDFSSLYQNRIALEKKNQTQIWNFSKKHPNVVSRNNVKSILKSLNMISVEDKENIDQIASLCIDADQFDTMIAKDPFNASIIEWHKKSEDLLNEASNILYQLIKNKDDAYIETLKAIISEKIPEEINKDLINRASGHNKDKNIPER